MTTNFVIGYLFKISYLKRDWITISIPWYDFCFSNAASILGCLETVFDKINIDSELIDDIDEDEIGSSKSVALSSLSVSD